MISETDYRFDRVEEKHLWPALIWEAGRDVIAQKRRGENFIWRRLQAHPDFPQRSWLELNAAARAALAARFSPQLTRSHDGAELLHFHTSNFATPETPEKWSEQLTRMGCVVLDLGMKGKHTRAELLGLFEAWLDANPDWCAPKKRKPSYGRRSPEDGLRAIAWSRICRSFELHPPTKTTVDSAAVDTVMRSADFKLWLRLPSTQPKRSKLKAEARAWSKRIKGGS